jgi:hypothetical protein
MYHDQIMINQCLSVYDMTADACTLIHHYAHLLYPARLIFLLHTNQSADRAS